MSKQSIREEWDKSQEYNKCFDENGYPNEKLTPFISSLISQVERETLEKVEDWARFKHWIEKKRGLELLS